MFTRLRDKVLVSIIDTPSAPRIVGYGSRMVEAAGPRYQCSSLNAVQSRDFTRSNSASESPAFSFVYRQISMNALECMVRSSSQTFDRVWERAPWCRRDVLNALLDLTIDIAREGREGRRIGTLFTLGHSAAVLAHSRPLILDPLAGHTPHATSIFDDSTQGTLKELAQLDGAFVVAEDGTVRAACRYLDVPAEGVAVPLGLGSRHLAAASVSKALGVVAIVVSQSSIVRVFDAGELIAEITPEI